MFAPIVGLLICGAAADTNAGPASANVEVAEEHVSRGVRLRRSGDDRGAKVEMEKAYQLAPTPRTAAQLGLVQQALGQWDDAELHLGEAIRAVNDPWIQKNQATLEKALAIVRSHVGSLLVTGEPEGAAVLLNGRPAGTLPLREAAHVIAGEIDVEVRASGYKRHIEKITVEKYQYRTLVVRLDRDEVGEQAPAASPPRLAATAPRLMSASSDAPAVEPRPVSAAIPPADQTGQRSGTRVAGWIVAGVGVVTAGVGVAEVLLGRSEMNDATAQAARANSAGDANLYADAQRTFSSGRTQRNVGWGLVAGGAATSVAGLVILLTAPRAREGVTSARRWDVSFDGKTGRLSWTGRW